MRRDILTKIEIIVVAVILIIIVVFGKDIMAAINEAIEMQTESMIDQLLR